ncbi:uncharacterized protein FIBRA_07042 [Fibroporia radiculosa]|uniref:WW domain-containing protein n=1 Tax=Fibroporia radiculosa TaxID=599839 RepID=J4H4E4_9APHY|nr:uncharacterized protein FIBRA_07042 [Fibroporia radiculosa]CCM04849.1 predicted protein [Fibroporia radiculosa]
MTTGLSEPVVNTGIKYESNSPIAVYSFDNAYINLNHSREGLPMGWTMYIHPRGWVYFRNSEYNVIVDEDIRAPVMLFRFMNCPILETFSTLPDGVEASFLNLSGSYFHLFVDHNQCTADYGATYNPQTVFKSTSMLRRRELYWNFVQQHPTHIPFPERGSQEAVDAIKLYYWDNLSMGTRSIVPFSKIECEELLRALDTPKGIQPNANMTSSTVLVAWILREVYSFRKADRFGTSTYRQMDDFHQSPVKNTHRVPRTSLLSRILLGILMNILCFGIPQTYLENVSSASEFRGRLSNLQQSWEKYTQELTQEYSDFILISTVLLSIPARSPSATMALLSVNDVYQAARVCAIMSSITALGSITLGAFMVWRHRRNMGVSPSLTFAYMHNARGRALGLPGHAILLSLPAVLLVWSLVGFTGAILAYALQNIASGTLVDVSWTWFLVGVFLLVLLFVTIGIHSFSVMWKWS